ncbi:S53 family peptidase [Dictyobacter arantiisoli]|uniref:Peptidase S8 n=1 Tax=Dictyobacter arantiisoli TaxID=2014874 RepID=A0A5A5TGV0_9CHLR|nr:S8 family serine peptidase [Dictyobacter arantiisoli]GCF10800.1 peptidase S8 [Dictyobacter arantiisoli]
MEEKMIRKMLLICLSCLITLLLPGAPYRITQVHASSLQRLETGPIEPHKPHRACPPDIHHRELASCTVEVLKPVPPPPVQAPGSFPTGGSIPYQPADILRAYNLPSLAPSGQRIAIVTAYDDPHAESDMATYRSTFGLPACSSLTGCFLKTNQTGNPGAYPPANTFWAQETSLDMDMVSAVCRNCQMLLVEANSASMHDLGTGVNTAASLGAKAISNSYGSNSEYSGESTTCNTYFNHNNIAVVASSGDANGIVQVPAVCPNVIGVGGTNLQTNGTETTWASAGGGCSTHISQPIYQSFTSTGCSMRAVPDVSAVADPHTGVYVYDTYNANGWYQMGGTSASTPILAAIYGLAGNANTNSSNVQSLWLRQVSGNCQLNTVPTGGNTIYSHQSGLGTPNGLGCF